MTKRVFIGMSGGVDSSVSAALLKSKGYDVTGVFIKVWEPPAFTCTWREDRRDAMRVAAVLDIPFITLDLSDEYKQGVVDYMIEEYRIGRTPNPDVMCNKQIKFGAFYDRARKMGADFVATGHYARIKESEQEKVLYTGEDKEKDQSYFLWNLKQDQLDHVLFPIGDYPKKEVRQLAKKFNLPTAEKKDSQGLCFIGKLDMTEFLKSYIDHKAGNVLNIKGEVIGTHEGVMFYTIGQRHGFSITQKGSGDKPLYVISKNLTDNTITVSNTIKQENISQIAQLTDLNWISTLPIEGKAYTARIRYRGELKNCYFPNKKNLGEVHFKNNNEPLPSGQSLVIYDGEICLGGGVIK